MKQITLALLSLVLAFSLVSAQTRKGPESKRSGSKVETTSIKVPTIVCEMCVDNVETALKKVKGVEAAKVDLKKKVASVRYNTSSVSLAKLERAIADAGYDANNTKRDQSAYDKLDACCKIDGKK